MAHRRDTASAAYNQSPPSPGYGVRDSIEGWIESLEFDVSLSTQLWASFLLNCWPVSDTGQPAHLPARISSTQGKGNSLDLRRAPQSMSASLWRQVDRWVNEGGAIGRAGKDASDHRRASSKEIDHGCAGD